MDAAPSARRLALHLVKLLRLPPPRPAAIALDLFASEFKLRFPLPPSPLPPKWPFLSNPRIGQLAFSTSRNHAPVRGVHLRHISQLVSASKGSKKVMFVDTLALVRRLESQGLTANQAEAITAAIIEVLNDSMDNVAQSIVSKTEMQKKEMMQEAALTKLAGEIKNSQENKLSSMQRETEKIRTDIDRLRSELRYEIDKVTAGQRLDINLERGRTREELANQSAETSNLTNKLDKEIHALKTQVEAAKYEVIKYSIGTIVSLTALGLGVLRIFM